MTAGDGGAVTGYHAHVYYDEESRSAAARLRENIGGAFEVRMGRWRDAPVGPHPRPMYQVAFAADEFASLVPWLMLNSAGLVVLVHPLTGDDRPITRPTRCGSARSSRSILMRLGRPKALPRETPRYRAAAPLSRRPAYPIMAAGAKEGP